MKIAFYRTKLDKNNKVVVDNSVRWYALTVSKAPVGAGRIISSTSKPEQAALFDENVVASCREFYSHDENRLNHQIMLDNA